MNVKEMEDWIGNARDSLEFSIVGWYDKSWEVIASLLLSRNTKLSLFLKCHVDVIVNTMGKGMYLPIFIKS